MTVVAADHLASRLRRLVGLSWMTGPILDKELRVSSRRRRSYVLRFAYIAVLTGLIALSWGDVGGFAGLVSRAGVIARMEAAGRMLTSRVVGFQFTIMQVLAVALLSTSFREEVQRRTLGVLMTTPITGWQFVMGKLLSKLLPMLTLLALSFPLLAIIRVFGGIPWWYVVSSLCITVTTMILMGSITLFFAAADRSAIGVIVRTVLTWVVVFLIPSWVAGAVGLNSLVTWVFVANPLVAMSANSMMWLLPGWGAPLFFGSFLWVIHCGIALGISALIVRVAARRVRSVGLLALQDGGATRRRRKKRLPPPVPLSPTTGSAGAPGVQSGAVRPSARVVGLRGAREAVRRVHGSPLIWKELRFYIPGSTPKTVLAATGVVCILALTYISNLAYPGARTSGIYFMQVPYMLLYFVAGAVVVAALAASTISVERESRALLLLLSLPVSDYHLILAKVLGVLYRSAPAWILLGAHLVIFAAARVVHPIVLVHMGMLVIWTTIFLTGTGLYFSLRFRSATSAATMNLGMAVVLWAIVPIAAPRYSGVYELSMCANPFVQLVTVTSAGSQRGAGRAALADLEYEWVSSGPIGVGPTTMAMFVSMLGYSTVGLLFAWRTKCGLRRYAFERH